jgi:hypothetical protein
LEEIEGQKKRVQFLANLNTLVKEEEINFYNKDRIQREEEYKSKLKRE